MIRRPDLRVNVLIGIREDALALLDAFKAVIPNLLSNRLRLENLDRAAGEAAIRGPLHRFNELRSRGAPGRRGSRLSSRLSSTRLPPGGSSSRAVGRGVVAASTDDDRDRGAVPATRHEQAVGGRGASVARSCFGERRSPNSAVPRRSSRTTSSTRWPISRLGRRTPRPRCTTFSVTPSGSKIAHRTRDLAGYAGHRRAGGRMTSCGSLPPSGSSGRAPKTASGLATRSTTTCWRMPSLRWGNRYRGERSVHDAERRRRRAFVVATAALVSLVLVAAIAVFALVERGHSRSQARRAHARELAAAASSYLE